MPAMTASRALCCCFVAFLVAISASQSVAAPRFKLSRQSLDALDTSFSKMLANAMQTSKQASKHKVTAAYADKAAKDSSPEAVQPEELAEVEALEYEYEDDEYRARTPLKPTLGEWFKKLLLDLQDEVDAQDVNFIPPSFIWPKKSGGSSSGDYQQPNSSPQKPQDSLPGDGVSKKKGGSGDYQQPKNNPEKPQYGSQVDHKGQHKKKGSSGEQPDSYSSPDTPQDDTDEGYGQEQDSSDEQPDSYSSPQEPEDGSGDDAASDDQEQDSSDDDQQSEDLPQEPKYTPKKGGQRKGSSGKDQHPYSSPQKPYAGSELEPGPYAPKKGTSGGRYHYYRRPYKPQDGSRPWHGDRAPSKGSSGKQHYSHKGPYQPRYGRDDSYHGRDDSYRQQDYYRQDDQEQYRPDAEEQYSLDYDQQYMPYPDEQYYPDQDQQYGLDEQHWPDYDDHYGQYGPDEQYGPGLDDQYGPPVDEEYDDGPRESEYACVQETARSECQTGSVAMIQNQIKYISSLSCCSTPSDNSTSAQSIFGKTAGLMSFSHAVRTAAASSSRNSSSKAATAAATATKRSTPKKTAGLPAKLASSSTPRMLLEVPSDGDAHCLWTIAYFKPVEMAPGTEKIGAATAFCRFGGPMEECASPLCGGLTLEISAEVYTTYAVSRDGPVPPATDAVAPSLDDSCACLDDTCAAEFDFGFDGRRMIRLEQKAAANSRSSSRPGGLSLGAKGAGSMFKFSSASRHKAATSTQAKSAAAPPVQDQTNKAPELQPAPTQAEAESATEPETPPPAPAAADAPAPTPATLAGVNQKTKKGSKGVNGRPAGYLDYRGAKASTLTKRIKLKPASAADNLARVAQAGDDWELMGAGKAGGKKVGLAKGGFKVPRASDVMAQLAKAEEKQMGVAKPGRSMGVAQAGGKRARVDKEYRGAKASTQDKRSKHTADNVQVSIASLEKYAGPMYGDRDYFKSVATESSVAKVTSDSGMFGGKATIIVGAITSVEGLKGVQYSHGLVEHVVRFEGAKKLTAARYEDLPYDTPHIFPGKYKIVLMEGKSSELEYEDLDFGAY